MSKLKIEIKNRWTGTLIFEWESENNTVANTVTEATKAKADLSEADLSKADLSEANLSEANLSKADLSEADLSEANLSKADLSEANLSEANLSEANLSWANLSWANLSEADLSWANLSIIKADFWSILLPLKKEVPAFKQALLDGNIDGSTYDGQCRCLVGTMEKICETEQRPMPIFRNSNRPAERWFFGISKGDTPETNQVAKITLEWIEEFELYINA